MRAGVTDDADGQKRATPDAENIEGSQVRETLAGGSRVVPGPSFPTLPATDNLPHPAHRVKRLPETRATRLVAAPASCSLASDWLRRGVTRCCWVVRCARGGYSGMRLLVAASVSISSTTSARHVTVSLSSSCSARWSRGSACQQPTRTPSRRTSTRVRCGPLWCCPCSGGERLQRITQSSNTRSNGSATAIS